ncbi:MAG TPA: BamA/TamA family outer membrane protein [Steroidobacteraceae bacterium]|nr:BamA/TamA family outer membrane protein [Steroidobacteraceae bacterium]
MSNKSGVLLLIAIVLLYGALPARGADPQPYKVDLASTGDSALNATLKATSELETLRKTAPVGPFGLIGRARGDLERLKTVLESFGYYQSYVEIRIDGLPLDDPGVGEELTSRSKDNDSEVKITFSIGPLYHLRKIEIDGQVPPDAEKTLALESGAPAIAADVLAAGDRLLNSLEDKGYAFAKVDTPIAHEDPPNRVLDVSFHVETGSLIQIGEIRIRGLEEMKEAVVRKRLLLHTGEQYGATKIETARKDLLALGVFASVSVRVGTKADSQGRVPVTFNARERPQHAVSLSGAYSSDLGGSTGVSWTKRNVSGKADSLTLSATAINLGGGTSTNGIGYDVNGKYLIPDWKERNQSLQVAVGAIRQSLDAYDQTAYTGTVTVNRKLSSIWSISAGFGIEQERIDQHECFAGQCEKQPDLTCLLVNPDPPPKTTVPPACDERFSYTLLSLPITALFNTTGQDSPLEDATHGMRVSLSVTPTFSFGHPSTRFFISQATGSLYFDLNNIGLNKTPGRSVLALRALAGLAAGASQFSLPPDQRFYAGGSGTIRGYRYQAVGPLFANGNPVGGTAINAGTVEYRQRFGTNFGTAAFLDAGNVSKNLNPINGELKTGAGVGLRYYTPIGPIRLDVAVPLQRRSGPGVVNPDDSFEIYIGLGQAF